MTAESRLTGDLRELIECWQVLAAEGLDEVTDGPTPRAGPFSFRQVGGSCADSEYFFPEFTPFATTIHPGMDDSLPLKLINCL